MKVYQFNVNLFSNYKVCFCAYTFYNLISFMNGSYGSQRKHINIFVTVFMLCKPSSIAQLVAHLTADPEVRSLNPILATYL